MFKVGDKVKIVQKVPDYFNGWDNTWYEEGMDKYVGNGNVYTICYIIPQGIQFGEDDRYYWPPEALELAEQLSKEEKLYKKINKLYKKCPTTKHWAIE